VANTYTLNDWYGDGVVVEGAGFLLNNEMDDFSIKPGVPNMYGVVGGSANAIAPASACFRRWRRALRSGTVGWRWSRARPGVSTIFTSVFQAFLNLYEFPHERAAGGRGRTLPPPAAPSRSDHLFAVACALPAETLDGLRALAISRAQPVGVRGPAGDRSGRGRPP